MLLYCLVGIIAACLTIFLNYCIGKPGSDKFSPYEIFSSYTVWLSYQRLKKVRLADDYVAQVKENIVNTKTVHGLIQLRNDYRKMLYEAAEPFFTWERALGMCPVCTGFWISLFTGIVFILRTSNFHVLENYFNLIIIIVISHVTIRILSKFL